MGLLLSPKAHKTLLNIESISPRIIIAIFNGNPEITVVSCYSPTNTAENEEVEEFYCDLAELIKSIPKHNFTLIGGDMNVQIGKIDAKGSSYHEQTNQNDSIFLILSLNVTL